VGKNHVFLETDLSAISPEMALRLEKSLGSTADTWLRMQMNYDLAQLRSSKKLFKVERLVAA
jgi:antitoxin HigA-1